MSDATEPLSALMNRMEALAEKAADYSYLTPLEPATVLRFIAAVRAGEALAEAVSRAADMLVEDPSSYLDVAGRLHEAVADLGRKT